jgi:hypothetical protein
LDTVCLECGRSSVFDGKDDPRTLPGSKTGAAKAFKCARSYSHELVFVLEAAPWLEKPHVPWVMKIGQDPSLADLAQAQIGEYRKPLGEELYRAFNRGIGLAAHGVGAGSFVYLRRVFEALIRESESVMGLDPTGQRMDKRIQNAAEHLPPFLVKNRTLYGILSTGVHELTEEECLEHFSVVRTAIELILDEKIASAAREKKVADAERGILLLNEKLRERGTEK